MDTKYTKIIFQEWERNEIEFTTTVTMSKATEKDFNRLLTCINTTHQQLGKKTIYKLRLNDNLNKVDNFEIMLLVKMPKDIFVEVESSFGNVEMFDAVNDFKADISFANLHVENLLGSKNSIELKHGKLRAGNVNQLSLNVQFSQVNIDEAGLLILNTRFSTLKIDRAKSIELTSAHDNVSIRNSVDKIEGTAEFGTFKIGTLRYSCVFTKFSFSKITIDKILESFTNISFVSAHSTIDLNIPQDQSFAFDYSGSFTDFKDEKVRWNYATFEAGNNSLQISGFYGSHQNSGKSVKIRASFGSVSLFGR